MMSKPKFPIDHARKIAERVKTDLAPFCERIEIAGSIRRNKSEVGDIEIVAIPKFDQAPDLFGEVSQGRNLLEHGLDQMIDSDTYYIKNGPRYKQIVLPEGINLDLFIVLPPAQWGVIFAIRTGPGDFSKWLVTPRKHSGALPSHCQVKDGAVWAGGEIISMPEEEDFFDFLGVPPLVPEQRETLPRDRI